MANKVVAELRHLKSCVCDPWDGEKVLNHERICEQAAKEIERLRDALSICEQYSRKCMWEDLPMNWGVIIEIASNALGAENDSD